MKKLSIKFPGLLVATLSLSCAPAAPAEGPNSSGTSRAADGEPASGETPYDPGIFTFAPKVGSSFQHTMHRREEVAVIGAPMRNIEEWEVTWDIRIKQETNLTVFVATLVDLKFSVNDAQVLRGEEVKGAGAYMELLFDEKGRVVDIRRTKTVTQAILDVSAPEARPALAQVFSAQNLRVLFFTRANERIRDLVGRSARVGETWGGRSGPDGQGPVAKALTVSEIKACGEDQCVVVERDVIVDKAVVWEGARHRVAEYVKAQGGDPETVKLIGAEVELKDEIFVNPHNLQFHGATFSQKAQLTAEGPKGALSVSFSTLRESTYKY